MRNKAIKSQTQMTHSRNGVSKLIQQILLSLACLTFDTSAASSNNTNLTITNQTSSGISGGEQANLQSVNRSRAINLTEFEAAYDAIVTSVIPRSDPRIQAHIVTDKPVYQPGDIMFIEVLLFDAMNHTPRSSYYSSGYQPSYSSPSDQEYSLYASLQVLDPSDTVINTSYAYSQHFTISFTYLIPDNAAGGDYKIVADGSQFTQSIKVVRIRKYEREQLLIQVRFNSDTYRPGDTVQGLINVQSQEGTEFQEPASYSLVVSSAGQLIQRVNGSLSLQGLGNFTFQIPNNASIRQVTLVFNVRYQSLVVPYTRTLILALPDTIVINFIPETYNYVYGVPNKVYFQAFSNDQLIDTIDLDQGALRARSNSTNQVSTIVDNLRTLNLGRGYFIFTPQADQEYFVELPNLNKQFNLFVQRQPEIDDWEINFSVEDKVVENNQDLAIRIFTNDKVDPKDIYVIGIFNKEQYLYLEELQFQKSTSYRLVVPSAQFNLTNGGVLRLTLFRVIRALVWYDRFTNYVPYYNLTLNANNQTISPRTNLRNPLYAIASFPKGELLFFKKPAHYLDVNITTDKEVYQPGDLVTFEVRIRDRETGRLFRGVNNFVSVYVTDESVFSQVPPSLQPPSLPAMIYLEKEVLLRNFEFYHANNYLEHLYHPILNQNNLSTSEEGYSSDLNLDLLLGIQGWRYGYLFPQVLLEWQQIASTLSVEQQYQLQNVLAFEISQRYFPYYTSPVSYKSNSYAYGAGGGGGAQTISLRAAPVGAEADIGVTETSTTVPSTGAATLGAGAGQPVAGQTLALSERERQIWQFIQRYKYCDFVPNLREYAHASRLSFLSDIGSRFDLTQTLYYVTANLTTNGHFKGQFFLSDLVTRFRITANAFDSTGRLGYNTETFISRKPLFVTMQLPTVMTVGDALNIPVYIFNTLQNETLNVKLEIVGTGPQVNVTLVNQTQDALISVSPSQNVVRYIRVEALNITYNAYVQIRVEAQSGNQRYLDSITDEVQIVSSGVQQVKSQTGILTQDNPRAEFDLTLPSTMVPGTLEINAQVYPNDLQRILQALKNLITYPRYCLDCISGIAYAQIYSIEAQQNQPETSNLKSDLQGSYQFLLGFQSENGSFSQFQGGSPDLMGTAEALLLLSEINNVIPSAADTSINKTADWLLSQASSSGYFAPLPPYSFAYPDYIANAFILWALTSAGYTNVTAQLQNLTTIADQQMRDKDANAFFLGLLGATLYNLNRTDESARFADYLTTIQNPDGSINQVNTFFSSRDQYGNQFYQEATAMAAILWEDLDSSSLYTNGSYLDNTQRAINYLVRNTLIGYYYYPTLLTMLSFRAIINHLRMTGAYAYNFTGDFVLQINGNEIDREYAEESNQLDTIFLNVSDTSSYGPGSSLAITLQAEKTSQAQSDLYVEENDKPVASPIAESPVPEPIRFSNDTVPPDQVNATRVGEALGQGAPGESESNFSAIYQINVIYDDTQPQSSANRTSIDLKITPQFNADQLGQESSQGESFSYQIQLTNKDQNRSVGLTIVVFKAPSCLTMNFDAIEQLRVNGIINQYEFKEGNSEVWLYFQGLNPGEQKTFNIDLIQRYTGECRQRPQEAFEFYNNQNPVYVFL